MADNLTLNAGSGGSDLATDDIGSVHYQIVKITYGALDSQTIAASGAGAVSAGVQRTTLASDDPAVALLTTVDADTSTIAGDTTSIDAKLVSGTVIGDVNLGATDNAVLDQIEVNTSYGDSVGGGTEAAALRVTLANNSTGVLSVDDNGGALTVDNGGTFATQATLQAGTAEIGKLAAGTAAIGKLAANSGVDIGDVDVLSSALPSGAATSANQLPATSGGISTVYRDEDIDETAVALKAGAGQIYWIHVVNLDATPVYLHFYDVAQGSVTVGTTGELCSFVVPSQGDANGAGFTMHFNHGIEFGTAITIACTTTIGGTAGPGLNEVLCNIGYE